MKIRRKSRQSLLILLLFILLSWTCSVYGETEQGYDFEIKGNRAEIISWHGNTSDVILPLSLGGYPVSGIRAHAFENNSEINSIVIPSTVEFIGKSAFANCSNLSMITVSAGLKNIGEGAFAGCTNLNSFTLPSTLETIGREAFKNCENLFYFFDLTDAALKEVGRDAFQNTGWLSSRTEDMITICHGQMLIKYQGNQPKPQFPWTIIGIAEDAFRGNDYILSLELPNYISQLGIGAISGMENLEEVSGGAGLKKAAFGSFAELPHLHTVNLPIPELSKQNFIDCPVSPYGTEYSVEYDEAIFDSADLFFESAYSETLNGVIILHCINDVQFSDGIIEIPSYIRGIPVVAIGAGACQNRLDIEKLILPEYLREIHSWAFAYDENLKEIVFPKYLKRIEADAFNNCAVSDDVPELTGIDVDERAFYNSK